MYVCACHNKCMHHHDTYYLIGMGRTGIALSAWLLYDRYILGGPISDDVKANDHSTDTTMIKWPTTTSATAIATPSTVTLTDEQVWDAILMVKRQASVSRAVRNPVEVHNNTTQQTDKQVQRFFICIIKKIGWCRSCCGSSQTFYC
jgi:hypothetical protein